MNKKVNKKKKKKINKVKIIFGLIIITCFILLGLCIKNIYDSISSNGQKQVQVLDSIELYGYQVDENDSKYFQETFKDLKKLLNSDDYEEKEYASLISKLFIIDFYSLKYAINSNDVGGKQFVYNDYQDDFVEFAKDSVYKYVKNNIYGNRDQKLPNIKNVEITNIEQDEYDTDMYSDKEAYYVDIEIEYDEDLEYPIECSLIIVHSNDKLEIVSME